MLEIKIKIFKIKKRAFLKIQSIKAEYFLYKYLFTL